MDDPPATRGIVLIGYRATGKTTVGRVVAQRVGRPFVDSDAEIERRSGSTIAKLFATQGESAFRVWEERTLREIRDESPGAVLATGGGSILRETNRQLLSQFGTVYWLGASPAILFDRLRNDPNSRPALTPAGLFAEVQAVLNAREPLYQSIADLLVDAGHHPPEVIAEQIVRHWHDFARTVTQ